MELVLCLAVFLEGDGKVLAAGTSMRTLLVAHGLSRF